MGKVGNKSIDFGGGKRLCLHLQAFHGNKWAHNGLTVSKSLISPAGRHKGRERSVIPRVCRPERPATVKVSYLSSLMTRFDVSPFISEHASHRCAWRARRGLSPVPWTSPFVVNRPKSSLRRKSALPVVRLVIVAQLSGLYKKKKIKDQRASMCGFTFLTGERREVLMCVSALETGSKNPVEEEAFVEPL